MTKNSNTTNQNLQLTTAIAIASDAHEGQLDQGGHAYILHCIRVMQRLRTSDPELMQMAILHDTVEDSGGRYTIKSLTEAGFSKRVTNVLELLTHDKSLDDSNKSEEENYMDYVRKIATNVDAILIKLEDLRDNSDITRLKGLRDKDFKRAQKYNKAFVFLTNTLANLKMVGYGPV